MFERKPMKSKTLFGAAMAASLMLLGTAAQAQYAPRHDLDRDGIQNRYDKDRDGDGIANHRDPNPNVRNVARARTTGPNGDLDRDGIRNRNDRDRDGDRVVNSRDRWPDNWRRA
jgi:hypothetical protein